MTDQERKELANLARAVSNLIDGSGYGGRIQCVLSIESGGSVYAMGIGSLPAHEWKLQPLRQGERMDLPEGWHAAQSSRYEINMEPYPKELWDE